MNGGQLITKILQANGIRHLFTLCGGHIGPIYVEAERAGMRVWDVRHEATAVFAADAVARLTGDPGVAAVTAGPGRAAQREKSVLRDTCRRVCLHRGRAGTARGDPGHRCGKGYPASL